MRIAIVVASDLDGVIGRDGGLPWHLPADLRHFKRVTMGKPMILGRRTWESIGRALPGRTSIVLTRRADFAAPGGVVARTPEEALDRAREALVRAPVVVPPAGAGAADEVAVIGGAQIFRIFLPRTDRLYWTQVQARVGGDVRFPAVDPAAWVVVERSDRPSDADNVHALRFLVLERRGAGAS